MIINLLKWLLFSVILSVLPIAANAVSLTANGRRPDLTTLMGKGELLLIAGGLCAASLGEVIESSRNKYARLLSGGCCTVMLVLSSLLFAAFTEARLSNPQTDVAVIVHYSLFIFLGSVVTSSICAALAE